MEDGSKVMKINAKLQYSQYFKFSITGSMQDTLLYFLNSED